MNDTPTAAALGRWDRLAIVLLGAAGCALSYDALQQMAVAIHVRGDLTYIFPLVIDGFIAYGVRALILLRTAPLRARLYVWALFGTATTASIWANALHAVRLNQQTNPGGLRLGDSVVAVLSTLAPLALAGAVHLYILITRHHPTGRTRTGHAAPEQTARVSDRPRRPDTTRTNPEADHLRTGPREAHTAGPDQQAEKERPLGPASRSGPSAEQQPPATGSPPADHSANQSAQSGPPRWRTVPAEEHGTTASGPDGPPGTDQTRVDITAGPTTDQPQTPDRTAGPHRTGPTPDRTTDPHQTGPTPDRDGETEDNTDRSGSAGSEPVTLEALLPIARKAALAEGRMTRKALRPHLRNSGIPLSNERFTALQQRLYRDPALAHLPQSKRRAK